MSKNDEVDFDAMFGETGKFKLSEVMGDDAALAKPLDATATAGFALGSQLDLKREVNTLQEFAMKFVDTVERMLDEDPHNRNWQGAMFILKKDAEKVLTQ